MTPKPKSIDLLLDQMKGFNTTQVEMVETLNQLNGNQIHMNEKLWGDGKHGGFKGDLTEIKEQVKETNGSVRQHDVDLATQKTEIKELQEAKKMSIKARVGFTGGGLLVLLTTVLQILQALGG